MTTDRWSAAQDWVENDTVADSEETDPEAGEVFTSAIRTQAESSPLS
jgi:hypothetical protein